jgi:hypothetical protein
LFHHPLCPTHQLCVLHGLHDLVVVLGIEVSHFVAIDQGDGTFFTHLHEQVLMSGIRALVRQ